MKSFWKKKKKTNHKSAYRRLIREDILHSLDKRILFMFYTNERDKWILFRSNQPFIRFGWHGLKHPQHTHTHIPSLEEFARVTTNYRLFITFFKYRFHIETTTTLHIKRIFLIYLVIQPFLERNDIKNDLIDNRQTYNMKCAIIPRQMLIFSWYRQLIEHRNLGFWSLLKKLRILRD